jgi:hypothetical protein
MGDMSYVVKEVTKSFWKGMILGAIIVAIAIYIFI